jgi:hypothetical protein
MALLVLDLQFHRRDGCRPVADCLQPDRNQYANNRLRWNKLLVCVDKFHAARRRILQSDRLELLGRKRFQQYLIGATPSFADNSHNQERPMTPQQPEFIALVESVKRIEQALLGDGFTGRKGIIHYHDQTIEDLYGIDSDGKPIKGKSNTVLNRISDLEDNQKKVFWIFGGVLAALTAIKLGWTTIVERFFSK